MAKTKIPGEYLKDSVVRFTAKAGENITKGQAIYISGISGEVPVVSLADADDTNKMPAFGLAESTVSTNGSVEITSNGTLAGIDTSSYALGDILYISTTAGSLTNDPSGLEASKVQNIGMVQRVHASNGSIKVGGAGRTNATPNLNDGNIFVGNSSNKSVSDAFTDVLNDQAGINSSANATAITIDSSENVGIGTTSPSHDLTIQKSGQDNYIRIGSNSDGYDAGVYFGTNADWSIGVDNSNSNAFSIASGSTVGTNPRVTIDSSGSVGIGMTNPSGMSSNANKLVVGTGSGNQGMSIYAGTSIGRYAFARAVGDNTDAYDGGMAYDGSRNLTFHTNANAERMRIDGSGNVGIGEGSPANLLHVKASDVGAAPIDTALMVLEKSGTNYLSFMGANTNTQGVLFGDADDNDVGQLIYNHSSNHMAFSTAASERMRIDSSGNLLVGNTVVNPVSGFASQKGFGYAASTGKVEIATDANAAVMELGKNNANDGSILVFRKQSNVVGSIGIQSSTLQVGTGNTQLAFADADDAFFVKNEAGTARNGSHDLGKSNARFKDLHLNGQILFGGNSVPFESGNTLSSSTNYDSLFTNGHYRIDNNATNAPSNTFHAVIVFGNGSNVTSQIAVSLASTTTYIRSYNNSWTSWARLDT